VLAVSRSLRQNYIALVRTMLPPALLHRLCGLQLLLPSGPLGIEIQKSTVEPLTVTMLARDGSPIAAQLQSGDEMLGYGCGTDIEYLSAGTHGCTNGPRGKAIEEAFCDLCREREPCGGPQLVRE
jgi:hypothetical protein